MNSIGPQKEAIVLVGGTGSRLRNTVSDRPKPLAVVAGKPFLEWLLISLRAQGVARIILSTGYLGEMIEEHFGTGSKLALDLVYVRDPIPLGTAGALRNALVRYESTNVLALNGDSYCRFDLRDLVLFHTSHHSKATLVLTSVEDSSRFGTVDVDEDARVIAFKEKAPDRRAGWINTGVYLLSRETLQSIPEQRPRSLEVDVFPALVGKGLFAMMCKTLFWDIGTAESYGHANAVLAGEFAALAQQRPAPASCT